MQKNNVKKSKLADALLLAALGILAMTAIAGAQTTDISGAYPLSASCNWTAGPAGNVITWTVGVSGGVAPYTYYWIGNQITGDASASVTTTYGAIGTYPATVLVTDANYNSAAASCSASVKSIPPNSIAISTTINSLASSSSAVTSENITPTPISATATPQTLLIGQNGSFLGSGMLVTSVGSSTFQGDLWGIAYTIDWSNSSAFYLRDDNSARTDPLDQLAEQLDAGDVVNVFGTIDSSSPLVVDAGVVRDESIVSPRLPRFAIPSTTQSSSFANGDNYNPGSGSVSATTVVPAF